MKYESQELERLGLLGVSVILIIADFVLHAFHMSDEFTDSVALIAIGAVYSAVPSIGRGIVRAARPRTSR